VKGDAKSSLSLNCSPARGDNARKGRETAAADHFACALEKDRREKN